MISSTNEHRRSRRVPVTASASLYADQQREASSSSLAVANVSETGVALEGLVELKIGDHYQMRLCLPDGVIVNGLARIVWKNTDNLFSSYGAELVEINWWDKLRLKSYLRREAPGADRPDMVIAGCLALPAGVVWYHLIESFGWTMAIAGFVSTLFLGWIQSRRS